MTQDFSPQSRRSGIWATDARKIANGQKAIVWLEKTGRKDLDDLSDVEAVQMGKLLQEPIMRIAAERYGWKYKEAEYAMEHRVHPWMKSHFDYIMEDRSALIEVKNYNAGYAKKFDEDANIVPNADVYQCLHEATVHGVDTVFLVVLFGGQALKRFEFHFTDEQKQALIETEERLWDMIQQDVAPPADDTESAKLMFPIHVEGKHLITDHYLFQTYQTLAQIKEKIKALESAEEELATRIMVAMQDAESLIAVDGSPLVTWKAAKESKSFDDKAFKEAYPKMYEQFVFPKPGSRRFLVK